MANKRDTKRKKGIAWVKMFVTFKTVKRTIAIICFKKKKFANQFKKTARVPWWLSRFRIWCCHCCGSGHCCGADLIQEFPPATGTAKK